MRNGRRVRVGWLIAAVACAAVSGCGETFRVAELVRASDGAVERCGTGTYAPNPKWLWPAAPEREFLRCVSEREKEGFAVRTLEP
jgi:hypothetical protein